MRLRYRLSTQYFCKAAVLLNRSFGSLCQYNFILKKQQTKKPTMTLESCSAYLGAPYICLIKCQILRIPLPILTRTIDGNAHQKCMASSCCSTSMQVFCKSYIKFIIPVDVLNILEHLRCQQAPLWLQKCGKLDL